MSIALLISPRGKLFLDDSANENSVVSHLPAAKRITRAYSESSTWGLLELATVELQTYLPPDFGFARNFAREYFTRFTGQLAVEAS